jgi:TfoX/Sxy family transcriptional regulator of competence genes
MASTEDYLVYIMDILRGLDGITHKKMMGEYLLYEDGCLFGGIYDNRFLVKKTASSSVLGLSEEIPYPGAKPMLLIESEDPYEIRSIIIGICKDIKK